MRRLQDGKMVHSADEISFLEVTGALSLARPQLTAGQQSFPYSLFRCCSIDFSVSFHTGQALPIAVFQEELIGHCVNMADSLV